VTAGGLEARARAAASNAVSVPRRDIRSARRMGGIVAIRPSVRVSIRPHRIEPVTSFYTIDSANARIPEVREILLVLRAQREELIRLRDRLIELQGADGEEAAVDGGDAAESGKRASGPGTARDVATERPSVCQPSPGRRGAADPPSDAGRRDQMQASVAKLDGWSITLRDIDSGLIRLSGARQWPPDLAVLAAGRERRRLLARPRRGFRRPPPARPAWRDVTATDGNRGPPERSTRAAVPERSTRAAREGVPAHPPGGAPQRWHPRWRPGSGATGSRRTSFSSRHGWGRDPNERDLYQGLIKLAAAYVHQVRVTRSAWPRTWRARVDASRALEPTLPRPRGSTSPASWQRWGVECRQMGRPRSDHQSASTARPIAAMRQAPVVPTVDVLTAAERWPRPIRPSSSTSASRVSSRWCASKAPC